MEIWHHISFGYKDAVDAELQRLNIQTKHVPMLSTGYLLHFEIKESDPAWVEIESLAQLKSAVNIPYTIFTRQEILEADWSRLSATFEHGYPQPESNHQLWRKIVYEDLCSECGTNYRQVAPFHIKREPRLGNHEFMSLYWTRDIFASNNVFTILEQHAMHGYQRWPVIIHRTDQASEIISQLLVPAISKPGLIVGEEGHPDICAKCSTPKYPLHRKGIMQYKRNTLLSDKDIQMSHEWFGLSPFTGYREILISKRFARLILDEGWRGIKIDPLHLV